MNKLNPLLFLKIFISFFYVGFGLFLISNPHMLGNNFSHGTTMTLGGVLIAYGIFRGYRVYKSNMG
ncbi:MAG: hypothetical protein ACK4ND_02005 [Cytophagaceae bacterium]